MIDGTRVDDMGTRVNEVPQLGEYIVPPSGEILSRDVYIPTKNFLLGDAYNPTIFSQGVLVCFVKHRDTYAP